MKIVDVKKTEKNNNPHGIDARKLYDYESAQVVHLQLEPGQALKPHITPTDVFFYILEGTPSIEVGEEKIQVSQDNLVESPSGIMHCIYNDSDARARVLVVKAPRPVKKTRIL